MSDPAVIVYFDGTFVDRKNGAHARVSSLLSFLCSHGRHIILYSYMDHPDCPWTAREIELFSTMYPSVELVLDRRTKFFRSFIRFKKFILGVLPNLLDPLVRLTLPKTTPNYCDLCRRFPDAVLIVNYTNGMLELNGIEHRDTIIETHDLDFVLFHKKFGHPLNSLKVTGKFRSEIGLLQSASAIIAIAAPEAGLFRLFFPEKPVFFVPDFSEHDDRDPVIGDHGAGTYDMIFVGSDNPLNVAGLSKFIDENRGWLQDHTLAVVGEVGSSDKIRVSSEGIAGISLLGYVKQLEDVYRHSRVAISPVDGTGLKIKVIEALAEGLPVFGSRHTIEGLPPGSERCVFPISPQSMSAFFADPQAQETAAKHARLYSRHLRSNGDTLKLIYYLRKDDLQRQREPLVEGVAESAIVH